jgi:hypothetical protein
MRHSRLRPLQRRLLRRRLPETLALAMPVAVPWVTQVLALEMLAAGTVEDSVIAVDLAEETAEETLDRLAVAEVEQIRAQPIVAGVRAV